jgi:4-hydroxy-tetrahydrodipicolinate reductase
MSEPIRLAVNGARGRMGRLVCELAADDTRFDLVARCDGATHWDALPPLDVVVDFSAPAGLSCALDHCVSRGIALVSGTTGFDDALRARLDAAASRLALLHAANFSLGIEVLTRLVREAAAALPDWDLDILETHHAGKRDAPSGTALALGRAAAGARAVAFEDVAAIDRRGTRADGSIGFASLRVGDVVGEHTALLATAGERLELSHRATDRTIFARGALRAAVWLAGRAPGRYGLDATL